MLGYSDRGAATQRYRTMGSLPAGLPAIGPLPMLGALLAILIAASPALVAGERPQRPYSCRLYDAARRQCASGNCDERRLIRLELDCVRGGGRPPYSCRLYDATRRQCASGNCDEWRLIRLERECVRGRR